MTVLRTRFASRESERQTTFLNPSFQKFQIEKLNSNTWTGSQKTGRTKDGSQLDIRSNQDLREFHIIT